MDMGGNVELYGEKFAVRATVIEGVTPASGTGLRLGDHAALVYERSEEKYAFLAKYFAEGAERDEKLLFCLFEQKEEDAVQFLEQFGFAAGRHQAEGKLSFIDCRSLFFPRGVFSPDEALAAQRQTILGFLGSGHAGVRIAVDMSWVLGRMPGSDALMEYEARFNYFSRALNAITVCGYNQGLFPKEVIFNALQTHPVALKKGLSGKNPYYLDPSVFLGSESALISNGVLQKQAGERRESRTIQRVRAEFREGLKAFSLTPQEQRVVELILHFRSNQDISRDLFISINTVKQHIKNIYRKLGINKRMELVARFMKLLEAE